MKELRWMLLAVLALTACSLVVLQLVYWHDQAPPGPVAAVAAPPPARAREAGVPREPPAPPDVEAVPAAAAQNAPSGGAQELALSDCVERKALAAGVDRIQPTLPGRWPAIKRAREVRRLRRLELRVACEKELAQTF